MTTQEVADRLVELCRQNQNVQAINELYADNIVSVEPDGAPVKEIQGKEGVLGKTQNFFNMVEEFHGGSISDPVVADNFFSCAMSMDITFKGQGRTEMNELCMYQVQDGKIVREEFFFTPMAPGGN